MRIIAFRLAALAAVALIETDIPYAETTPEPLTLDEAIRRTLLDNPELKASYLEFEAMALESPQASAWPDPRVTYTKFIDSVQTRTGEQEFIAGVSQTFPWFGTLGLRGRLADQKAQQALEDWRVRALDLERDVALAWHELAYTQAAERLELEDKTTLENALSAAAALYANGQQGREAMLKAQTELTRVENRLLQYPASIARLQARLQRLLSSGQPVEIKPVKIEQTAPDDGTIAGLIEQAFDQRPELRAIKDQRDQAETQWRLAKKNDYPQITVGAGWIGIGDNPMSNPIDEGKDAWNVTLGFTIPLPHAGRRAAKRQALKKQDEAATRMIAAQERIEEEIRALIPRLRSLEKQQAILRDSLIPLAEETLAVSQSSYASGEASFLDLLEAQRTHIGVRRDLLDVQLDLNLAQTGLKRALGATAAPETKGNPIQ